MSKISGLLRLQSAALKQVLLIAFLKFVEYLEERLSQALPGRDAHILMAPMPVNQARFNFNARDDAKLASVLILLYPDMGVIKFPLIERPQYEGVHSGQIALPGGKFEPDDEDRIFTAKRETEEEIGVNRGDVNILGTLSEIYIPPSNFKVLPVIGYVNAKPYFNVENDEVVSLIETEVMWFKDPGLRKRKQATGPTNVEMDIPYFDINGHKVWGATAMILSEFYEITHAIIN